MNIFVTVGNTQYNQLIKNIDTLVPKHCNVTVQLADGNYLPKNHQYIRFTDDIEKCFAEADIVISHAGAGSVFRLLELGKKLIVVPNFERVDDHQLDLANFVHENNYACVCYELNHIFQCIEKVLTTDYQHYIHEPFNGFEQINELITANHTCRENNKVGGVPVDTFSDINQLVGYILSDAADNVSGSAIAINPEKIVRAIQDPAVKEVLLSASIRYPDGIGVVKTLCRKTGEAISRIPGVELWEALVVKAGKVNASVYLIGASEAVIVTAKEKLENSYNTPICGYRNGYFTEAEETEIIEEMALAQPKIVAVAMGSPKQELFIAKCQAVCPNAFYMGVGGSFDVFTEKVRRAPVVFRRLNLEWFYRVLHEPKRIFRQGNLFRYLWLELTRRL